MHYIMMFCELLGGLAIFLYGMEKMSHALKNAAGDRLKTLLANLTTNRLTGVLTGVGVTAVIQSSSVTTVLLVGFISAGFMSLSQAVGIIMGANIGTTVTAQIVAFKVTHSALVMIAAGFLIQFNAQKESYKHYGNVLFGLGLIFLGMNLMGEAMAPLRTNPVFINIISQTDHILIAILISAVFTALIQSSSATTGIVIMLAGQGVISLEAGIALAMGANIGTCVTAFLATIGKNREAMQAATIHILFNVIGVVLWIPFIGVLEQMSVGISPVYAQYSGIDRLSAELPRQIANANTLFNVANTLIMLPFSGVFIYLAKKVLPYHPKSVSQKKAQNIQLKYLGDEFLHTPDIALDQASLEIGRVGRRVCNMINMLPSFSFRQMTGAEKERIRSMLNQISQVEDEIDKLHAGILLYLGRLRKHPLSDEQSYRQIKLISTTEQLENIADLVAESLVPLAYKALKAGLWVSPVMHRSLDDIQGRVNQAMLDCVNSIRRKDENLAEQVLRAKRELNALQEEVLAHQAERLVEQNDNRLRVFRYEMEWIEQLNRIYVLSRRIAKLQLRKPRAEK
ncbi:Na/Pi cotransporter family protein [Vibrio salinus]|uniref:Na/Pi cotransporter family protein n=1 Tax=Vibrio salinus TaxID=2899784 RepID=UPI001E5CA0B4|nr:Na/Pi cotransporter family protein [Vibrio salinus]MCE0495481.1 Na/Pi cotransporter family protein [Vibrio salinus]